MEKLIFCNFLVYIIFDMFFFTGCLLNIKSIKRISEFIVLHEFLNSAIDAL